MKITLGSAYGPVKTYHLNPMKQANGLNYPFVKPVDVNGMMIMSDAERNSPDSQYFIPEDLDIVVTVGTTFDLDNPLEANKWECIKHSDIFAPSRNARDKNGDYIIDGNKERYGTAELYVDVPGEESARVVKKRVLISKAYQFIEGDSANGILTKCKLLGKYMGDAPLTDAQEFLYKRAEDRPEEIIDVYTNGDMALKLLFIDAREKGVIYKKDGLFMYGETQLGATDDSVMLFFKSPSTKAIVDMIKFDVYPEMRLKADIKPFPNKVSEPVVEINDKDADEPIAEETTTKGKTKTK